MTEKTSRTDQMNTLLLLGGRSDSSLFTLSHFLSLALSLSPSPSLPHPPLSLSHTLCLIDSCLFIESIVSRYSSIILFQYLLCLFLFTVLLFIFCRPRPLPPHRIFLYSLHLLIYFIFQLKKKRKKKELDVYT